MSSIKGLDPHRPSAETIQTSEGVWAVSPHTAGFIPKPPEPVLADDVCAVELVLRNLGLKIMMDKRKEVEVQTQVTGDEPDPLAIELVKQMSMTPLPGFQNREVATAWTDIVVARFLELNKITTLEDVQPTFDDEVVLRVVLGLYKNLYAVILALRNLCGVEKKTVVRSIGVILQKLVTYVGVLCLKSDAEKKKFWDGNDKIGTSFAAQERKDEILMERVWQWTEYDESDGPEGVCALCNIRDKGMINHDGHIFCSCCKKLMVDGDGQQQSVRAPRPVPCKEVLTEEERHCMAERGHLEGAGAGVSETRMKTTMIGTGEHHHMLQIIREEHGKDLKSLTARLGSVKEELRIKGLDRAGNAAVADLEEQVKRATEVKVKLDQQVTIVRTALLKMLARQKRPQSKKLALGFMQLTEEQRLAFSRKRFGDRSKRKWAREVQGGEFLNKDARKRHRSRVRAAEHQGAIPRATSSPTPTQEARGHERKKVRTSEEIRDRKLAKRRRNEMCLEAQKECVIELFRLPGSKASSDQTVREAAEKVLSIGSLGRLDHIVDEFWTCWANNTANDLRKQLHSQLAARLRRHGAKESWYRAQLERGDIDKKQWSDLVVALRTSFKRENSIEATVELSERIRAALETRDDASGTMWSSQRWSTREQHSRT